MTGFPWRVGKDGIYEGPRLIRACSAADAARTVEFHNWAIGQPPRPRDDGLDDDSDEADRVGRERDDAAREFEWFQ